MVYHMIPLHSTIKFLCLVATLPVHHLTVISNIKVAN